MIHEAKKWSKTKAVAKNEKLNFLQNRLKILMEELENSNSRSQTEHLKDVFIETDKVQMYEEETMTNDDNLESSLPTSSLLRCVLWYKIWYKLNCVFTARWQEMN